MATHRADKAFIWSMLVLVLLVLAGAGVYVAQTVGVSVSGTENLSSAITARDVYDGTGVQETVQMETTVTTPGSVSFVIGGDFMYTRNVWRRYRALPLEVLTKLGGDFCADSDACVVNHEGAVTRSASPGELPRRTFTFIFPPEAIEILKVYGINAVSLANNHSNNAGADGLLQSRALLRNAGIQPFGSPGRDTGEHVAIIDGHKLRLVLIGVHTLYQTPDIIQTIKRYAADERNRIIVMPHWGVEYMTQHNARQETLARAWIDAGADMIVGAHPHVVQDIGEYNGVPIVYSLGNFLFDQTERATGERGVQDGMIVRGTFTEDGLTWHTERIRLRDYAPEFVRE